MLQDVPRTCRSRRVGGGGQSICRIICPLPVGQTVGGHVKCVCVDAKVGRDLVRNQREMRSWAVCPDSSGFVDGSSCESTFEPVRGLNPPGFPSNFFLCLLDGPRLWGTGEMGRGRGEGGRMGRPAVERAHFPHSSNRKRGRGGGTRGKPGKPPFSPPLSQNSPRPRGEEAELPSTWLLRWTGMSGPMVRPHLRISAPGPWTAFGQMPRHSPGPRGKTSRFLLSLRDEMGG